MNIFKKKEKLPNSWCPKNCVWALGFNDDETFYERYSNAQELINRYKIVSPFGAKEVFKDFDIPCGTWKDLCTDAKEDTQILLLPFYPNK